MPSRWTRSPIVGDVLQLRVDGHLLGVGALKHLDGEHAEIKSMHTAEAARGGNRARAGRAPPHRRP